jgi:hypothetical protein
LLGAGDYLIGVIELAVLVAGAGAAATRVRGRLLPGWTGPPAWLADLVLGLALVILVAELLGTAGAFREPWLMLVVGACGPATRALIAPPAPGLREQDPPSPETWPFARWAALVVAGLVIAHWSVSVRLVLDAGITNFDTTWYHGPFAASFAQDGSTFDLDFIAPQFLAWFYPQNSELLHGVGILAFGRDFLSPLVNVAWLAGALLAAWCIGRPYGAGPQALVGAAVVLDAGLLADQAGSMRNDMPAIFFLTSAAAIALNARAGEARRLGIGALAIVGLCAGLAAGVKLNYLAPAAALLVGLIIASAPGARRTTALAAGLPLLAGCGYWYLRNLVHSGNPLPWVDALGLPGPAQELGGRRQESVLGYLFDGNAWDQWFLPGFHDGLGWAWPLVLALALGSLVACVWRGRDPLLRVLGAMGLAAALAWVAGPASAAGPEGMPLSFESGLRYLAPALILGLALLPAAIADARRGPPLPALLALLLALLVFADASGQTWHSGYVAGAIAVGVLTVAVAALLGPLRPRRLSRTATIAVAGAILLLVVGAGWVEQRRYLDHRYRDPSFAAPGLNAAFAWARDLTGERIATTATRQYPLWGTELSNEVRFAGVEQPHGGFVRAMTCRRWRQVIDEGDYDYVVASLDRIRPGGRRFPPEAEWTETPETRVILRRAPTVVFEVLGPLGSAGCRAAG